MENYGLLIGFAGIVLGAGITFIAEITVLKKQMRFNMSVEVRKSLMEMNNGLIKVQKELLDFYSESNKEDIVEHLEGLRKFHLTIMEIYKIYRIHLGDNKAYELNSAIYKYYFEIAKISEKSKIKMNRDHYESAYFSLLDSIGLMINDVRFELIKIHSLRKITKNDQKYKISEYNKYSKKLISRINEYLEEIIISFKLDAAQKDDLVYRALKTIIKRLRPFYLESDINEGLLPLTYHEFESELV